MGRSAFFWLLIWLCLSTVAFAKIELTIPREEGSILIENLQFLGSNNFGDTLAELSFNITNKTAFSWDPLKLQFDIGGYCNGEAQQWSRLVVIGLGWEKDKAHTRNFKDMMIPLVGTLNGCTADIYNVHVLEASGRGNLLAPGTLESNTKAPLSLNPKMEEELQTLKAVRAIAASAKAAREEKKRKQDATDALVALKKQQALQIESAKRVAAERQLAETAAAAERTRIRAVCASVYESTANKKLLDVTVKESQQIKACQVLNLYPPN